MGRVTFNLIQSDMKNYDMYKKYVLSLRKHRPTHLVFAFNQLHYLFQMESVGAAFGISLREWILSLMYLNACFVTEG